MGSGKNTPKASSSAVVGGKNASSSAAIGGKNASSSAAVGGKNASSSEAVGGKNASSSAAVGGKNASSSAAVGGKNASSSEAVGGKNASSSAAIGRHTKPYTRPRGGGAKAIGDLTPEIGRTAFRRFGFVQSSVVTRWPEIVGPTHARVCAPEAIRFPPGEKADGILQLVVIPAHAPLIQQVTPEIIERVNRFFGYKAVARIKLRHGAVTPPAGAPAAKPPPSLKPIAMELGDSLRDIGDPELRMVLESLARSLESSETRKQQQQQQDKP